MKRIIFLLLVTLSTTTYSFGQSHLDSLSMANRLYSEGKFDKAAQLYESVIKMGHESPELYYNLGNSYFKQQRIASAILNYERAALRNPSDEDILFNLELARSFTVDRIEPIPTFFLVSWISSISSWLSSNAWAYLSICFFTIALAFTGFFMLSNRINRKKLAFTMSVVAVVFTVLTATFSAKQRNLLIKHNYAIVFKSVVPAKSSPDTSGKDLFILHAGTKVKITNTLGQWYEIRLADGNKGWISHTDIVRI
ncbi:MAG: tetratricopeptide repeat protein [Bacteroidales bacterium]|nr:tetratricopeptide repeat protein [Bacteroidales bacterium]MBN2749145.1 tetratricopeptide repeat protein [Bacteroidales bacterium]